MPAERSHPYNWSLLFAFWIILCAAFILRSILSSGFIPVPGDTDDAMRLTIIHDWLAGQNWFDHMQYRLNTPYGVSLHWSRLVDVPIAALITLFSLFSPAYGETLALYAWPLILLLALLLLSSRLAVTLAREPAQLPGLALPVFALPVMAEFAPGRIDHHNVQIVLTLALVLTTVLALTERRWALWAGFAAATSLAIGTESIAFIAAAVLAFGLMWVAAPERGKAMRLFGLSFGGAALVHLGLALPPDAWLVPQCDALSVVYVAAAAGVGLVFALLALPVFAKRSAGMRLFAGVVGGGLLLALLAALFPQCLGGPYATLDPWLQENWIGRISEAKPVWESLQTLPGYTIGAVLPPLLALVVTLIRIAYAQRQDRRANWLVYGLFLLCAIAVMIVQVRGARLAAAMAVPAGAWVIVMARRFYVQHRAPLPAAGLVLAWLVFSGLPIAIVAALLFPRTDAAAVQAANAGKAACYARAAFADLGDRPATRIMAPVDLGAHMLLYTPHSVVGAPYHRNGQGIHDTYRFFNGSEAEARAILAERQIELVVICPALPEMKGLPDAAPDALVQSLSAGRLPDWLKDITPAGGVLHIYKVVSAAE